MLIEQVAVVVVNLNESVKCFVFNSCTKISVSNPKLTFLWNVKKINLKSKSTSFQDVRSKLLKLNYVSSWEPWLIVLMPFHNVIFCGEHSNPHRWWFSDAVLHISQKVFDRCHNRLKVARKKAVTFFREIDLRIYFL